MRCYQSLNDSIRNVLEALYLDSPIIKQYVDIVAAGNRAPFEILAKNTDNIQNEKIIERLRVRLHALKEMLGQPHSSTVDSDIELIEEMLDEAMTLEPEEGDYEIIMFKDGVIVDGSKQIVTADKIANKKQYADFKGYTITVKGVEYMTDNSKCNVPKFDCLDCKKSFLVYDLENGYCEECCLR